MLFKNVVLNKLLTETLKPLLTISVVHLHNLLLYLNLISFQHFKYTFLKIHIQFRMI